MSEELNKHFSYIMGERMMEAKRIVHNNFYIRVIKRDGEDIIVDSSYKENRLNVEIRNTFIVNIISIG